MTTYTGGAVGAPAVLRLKGRDFAFVAPLAPDRDASGAIREFSPQGRYAGRDADRLNAHGRGTIGRPAGRPETRRRRSARRA